MQFDVSLDIPRRKTRKVKVGNIFIGGDAPIAIQTMAKTKTDDVQATIDQIHAIQQAGADLVRVAVPDEAAARSLHDIKANIQIPLVADIHFNAKFAMIALEQGVHKLRLNPGNIRNEAKIRDIVRAAKERSVPIRIGVNAGSLDPDIRERTLRQHAARHRRIGQTRTVVFRQRRFRRCHHLDESLRRAHDGRRLQTLAAEELGDYPLHLGVTEAGITRIGTVKSAMGIGALLMAGIGDTLRVSLTGDPVDEVKIGWDMLQGLELRRRGPNVISCPILRALRY